jgi:hypothetical protein
MTFESASFFIGIVAGWVLLLVGAAVIATVQTRMREEAQWRNALSEPSPSETYRGLMLSEEWGTRNTIEGISIQPLPEGEEWIRTVPPSVTP